MILPSDEDYKETKLIKQGQKQLVTPFNELADWLGREFDVDVLNIYYDLDNSRPILDVMFEYTHDKKKFTDTYGAPDKKKQKVIADKLQELVEWTQVRLNTNNIWVVFSAFEPLAKAEANESIPAEKIKQLKARVAREDLWEISRFHSGVTFFFYTEEQVRQNTSNGVKGKLTEEYFNLLKEYDEFNYFSKAHFSIYLDSKENFDNNYQSNWYYYYK